MEPAQAVQLIRNDYLLQQEQAVSWADLGCGTGLFTHALGSMLPAESKVYAVDKTPSLAATTLPNSVSIQPVLLDFVAAALPFGPLDGILMANSLHFAADQPTLIRKLKRSLNADGCFLVVEYDTDIANRWVPYPLSFRSLQRLFASEGFSHIEKLQQRPSVYGRAVIYAALIRSTP